MSGGITKAFKVYFIWCLLLTIGGFLTADKYFQVKDNYTDLHRRVNQIERIINMKEILKLIEQEISSRLTYIKDREEKLTQVKEGLKVIEDELKEHKARLADANEALKRCKK